MGKVFGLLALTAVALLALVACGGTETIRETKVVTETETVEVEAPDTTDADLAVVIAMVRSENVEICMGEGYSRFVCKCIEDATLDVYGQAGYLRYYYDVDWYGTGEQQFEMQDRFEGCTTGTI